jgi:hypothetical protein
MLKEKSKASVYSALELECDSVYLHKYVRRGVSITTETRDSDASLCRAKAEGNHQSRRDNTPGFEAQPPARKHTEFDNHRDAHDGMGKKMAAVAPIELSKADPRLVLGKRLRAEMEALCSLVKKAELLVRKNANGSAPVRRVKEGQRFMEAEARRPDTTEGEMTSCAKKRKTMAVAKIVDSRISVSKSKAANDGVAPRRCNEGRRFLEAEARAGSTGNQKTECAKTMPLTPSEIVEPRMAKRETVSLERCVASISGAKTPTTHVAKDAAANAPVTLPSPCQLEEGEIIEEEEDDAFVDICGGVSPVPTVHRPAQVLLENGKTDEENVLVDLAGEAGNSPSSSSSSSGSSSSDSSDSDSSDSDSDDEQSVRSSPVPAVVAVHNVFHSPPCLCEDGGIEEGASPVAAEEYVATGNSPRNTSSLPRSADAESVGSSPAPSFLPERDEEPVEVEREEAAAQSVAAAPPAMSDLIAEAAAKMRRDPARQKAYDDLEAMERNAPPSDWIRRVDMTKFGITAVEYAVTSDRLVPGRGGRLQQWFKLSWRGEC